ncbi:RNA-directed DNA polymerase, eukaryota, reverse transcriptase zinc-binding domain protein [Tanacetum coccineum]
MKPSNEESKHWSSEMWNYFNEKWKGIGKGDEDTYSNNKFEENVYEEYSASWNVRGLGKRARQNEVKNLIQSEQLKVCTILETHVKDVNVSKVCDKVFGNWEWASNTKWSPSGDLNVTLKLDEHSEGMSCSTADMVEFQECIEKIELEDINKTGCHFTWTKSLRNPETAIMKKLDRIMGNGEFIDKFPQAQACFHPFIVSDHSLAVLIIPKSLKKKNISFRFSIYLTDKEEFITEVRQSWNEDVEGYKLYILEELKAIQSKSIENVHDQNLRKEAIKKLNEYNEAMNNEEKLYSGYEVSEQFVKHFKNFLGISRETKSISNANELFTQQVTRNEAKAMCLEVQENEIKEALKSIDHNKASGSDGYTAKNFKAAWEIVDKDVCLAIKEFFHKGKILGELNATIISLVPKIKTPAKGKQICAFKINIMKAYDTVNWVFLEKILEGFGFPGKFIMWIMTCVKFAAFSIYVNEESFGYFKGGKGLKQRDPMSPYMITIMMEVLNLIIQRKISQVGTFTNHSGCEDLKITNLCFADDLLILCNGDSESVKTIKLAMEEFSSVSGLHPNMSKSTMFCSNLSDAIKNEILGIVPFNVGKLPVRYLGVPLVTKRLSVKDCKSLVEKVKGKVGDWKNKFLSYAGRM